MRQSYMPSADTTGMTPLILVALLDVTVASVTVASVVLNLTTGLLPGYRPEQ